MNTKKQHNTQCSKFKLMAVFMAITISACSSQYTVSTNLDKGNFKSYFSHAKVKVAKDESEFPGRFKLIGMIEGQSCQIKSHHAAPDKVTARTHARKQAFQQQANAIIFTGCALIDSGQVNKQCVASIVCYGKAYQVEQHQELN